MNTKSKLNNSSVDKSKSETWFENMISGLKVDQLLMDTDVIDQEKGSVYKAMIEDDEDFLHNYARNTSSIYFIEKLVVEYITELKSRRVVLSRLAFELMNSKILVWAEIKDDDDVAEKALILSAAKVNNDFYKYGFHISPTIVEKRDNLNVPEQYKELYIKAS